MSTTTRDQAAETLRALVGDPDADFHDGQFEAISALVDDRRRALVVQRTGWGKSAVYFVATMLLRRAGPGPTMLVSPLLALMRDQVAAAERAGVRAVTINSANRHEWDEVAQRLRDDRSMCCSSPPSASTTRDFRDQQLPALDRAQRPAGGRRGALHLRLGPRLPARLPAAARPHRGDAAGRARARDHRHRERAGRRRRRRAAGRRRHDGVLTIRGPLARKSLRLGVLTLPDATARLAWLVSHLGALARQRDRLHAHRRPPPRTPRDCSAQAGYEARAYTGQTDPAEREELEDAAEGQRGQGAGRDERARHGLRQARPRVRRPPRRAVLAGRLLPAGRPRRPCDRQRRRAAAARAEDRAIWHYFATASHADRGQGGRGARRARLGAAVDAARSKARSTSGRRRSSCC